VAEKAIAAAKGEGPPQDQHACVPGAAFGATAGCYLRVSFGALDEATASEGADRLAHGLRAMAGA